MREMKDSGVEWIGYIPASWQTLTVGSLFKVRNEKVNDTDYPPLSVTKSGVVPQMENVAKSDANDNRKMVLANDFVINSRSDRKQSCGVSPLDGSVSLINTVLYPAKGVPIVPEYLNYLLKNHGFAEEFYRWGHGIVADLWTTRWQEMKSILLPIPSMEEQQQILDAISAQTDKVDALIANVQAQIEKLKAYKQSLITEVVTKGLDPTVPMKDSGVEWVSQIPATWGMSRVGLHYIIILGKMLCPNQIDITYSLEKYFCAANIHFGEIVTDELKEMWFSRAEKEQYHIAVGDMLIVEGGAGAGGCAIVKQPTDALVQNSVMIVRNLRGTDNRYLRYWIESMVKRGYLEVVCNKATIPHYTKEKLAKTVMPVLPQDEQTQIADFLDEKCSQIDCLIAIKQSKIEKLEQYKRSLIYEYVTGKKEV
jgi:type I restriction enzyme S subunit